MKYSSGERVTVGDYVKLWDGNYGVVVCSMDDNEYSLGYSEADWSYLSEGVLIKSEGAGLVHQTKADEDLELVRRPSS